LAGLAGALWFAGVFEAKVGKQGNAQAPAPKQEAQKAGHKETTPETPPRPKLTDKQKTAVADAIKALGKVEAAIQVGVNKQQYGQLVIDAKAAVNEAVRSLPSGELSTALTEAIDAYRDAGTVWNHKIRWDSIGLGQNTGDGAIITRYDLKATRTDGRVDEDYAMQKIWVVATAKLAQVRSLQ
jgi:hypothetical protein